MAYLEWNGKFSVQVAVLDEQHKKIFAMINDLDALRERKAEARVVGGVLVKLLDYAHHHFSTEENSMAEAGYPDLEAHRLEH